MSPAAVSPILPECFAAIEEDLTGLSETINSTTSKAKTAREALESLWDRIYDSSPSDQVLLTLTDMIQSINVDNDFITSEISPRISQLGLKRRILANDVQFLSPWRTHQIGDRVRDNAEHLCDDVRSAVSQANVVIERLSETIDQATSACFKNNALRDAVKKEVQSKLDTAYKEFSELSANDEKLKKTLTQLKYEISKDLSCHALVILDQGVDDFRRELKISAASPR